MGWEYRGNRRYYYQKKRVGKKVISVYIGTGPGADRIVRKDELERREREDRIQAYQRWSAKNKSFDDRISTLEKLSRTIRNAHLLLAGYHTHRGQWRKRRK